jgi:hypothetical protein
MLREKVNVKSRKNKLWMVVLFGGMFTLTGVWSPTVCPAGDSLPERVTKEGEGEAEIQEQDLSSARKGALEDALRDAFEKALLDTMPAGLTLGEQEVLLKDLGPMKKRFLMQYRILSEMPALQVFFVTVEATFGVALIEEELERRGVTWGEGTQVEPTEILVGIRGVTSFDRYQRLIELFRYEIASVMGVSVFEVFGTYLALRLDYEGGGIPELLETVSVMYVDEFEIRLEEVKDREIIFSLVDRSPMSGASHSLGYDPSFQPPSPQSVP